ncbi:MAG: zinc ribbon domain-containing protein [Thermodesulfobacteriota bacterium]
MKCNQCGLENPKQSKFCRKCGEPLGAHIPCSLCGSENPEDSLFCTQCGERLSKVQKSVKGNQRKCRKCGHFNELDASFCVACGEEMDSPARENLRRQSAGPSYKTIALVIGAVFLLGILVKIGTTFLKGEVPSRLSSPAVPAQRSPIKADEAQVIAVAKNFKCACGGCGELPLATCECDMPKGALEEKNFIREKLAEGFSIEQAIELLDEKYGHRVKG